MLSFTDWQIELTSFAVDGERIAMCRQACLPPEQFETLSNDGIDARAIHVIAKRNDRIIASARMTSTGQISAACGDTTNEVLQACLQALMDSARERKLSAVLLNADGVAAAIPIALQFVPDQLPIWRRQFELPTPIVRSVDLQAQTTPTPQSELFGGKTRDACRTATLKILAHCKRDLAIYTRDLDPAILDQADALEALRQIALRSKASIRVLVQDTARAVQVDHRLIELVRRLPSVLQLRKPQDDDLQFSGAFIVTDQHSYLERQNAESFECEGDLHQIGRHGQLLRYFNEVWDRAAPASELRRLSI
jgi:hypothetical protein